MSESTNGINKSYIIKWIVVLAVSCAILLIPTGEMFTYQMKMFLFFACLVILIVACELMPMLIPCLLFPAMLTLFKVVPAATAWGSFSNETPWMIFGAFALSVGLDECGLMKRICYSIIYKLGGSYNRTLFALYLAGVVIGQLCFCGHYMIMIAFTYGLCRAMDLKPFSKEAVVLMGVGGMAALNVKLFLYRPSTMNIMTEQIRVYFPDFHFGPLDQIVANCPEFFIALAFIWVVTKVCKTKDCKFEGGREYFKTQKESMGKMTLKEYYACGLLAIIMIWIFTENWHSFGTNLPFLIFPWLMFLPGKLNIAGDAGYKRLGGFLPTFIFAGVCLGIGQISNKLGLGAMLSQLFMETVGEVSFFGLSYATLLFSSALNLLLTPGAMYNLLPAILTPIYQALGFDPAGAILTVLYATDIIFMPHEVTAYLVMFGFGMMKMKHFVMFYGAKSILTILLFGLIQIPWWHFIGIC